MNYVARELEVADTDTSCSDPYCCGGPFPSYELVWKDKADSPKAAWERRIGWRMYITDEEDSRRLPPGTLKKVKMTLAQ